MARSNAQRQAAWRERRSAYIRQLEARIAQLEGEQAKGKRPRRRETDKERGGSAASDVDKRDNRARMSTPAASMDIKESHEQRCTAPPAAH